MSVYHHSQYRGDFANFPGGKVNGDDYPSDLANHPYTAAHESGDEHRDAGRDERCQQQRYRSCCQRNACQQTVLNPRP